MKLNPIHLLIVLFMVAITFTCCKKDEEEAAGLDPNVFCNEGICATNDAKKNQCIDAFNTCLATEPDANDDECAATALLICN